MGFTRFALINIHLVVLIKLLVLLNVLAINDPEDPNPTILQGMYWTTSIKAQQTNPYVHEVSKDKAGQPVEGTVQYGKMPHHFGPGPVESEKAGKVLVNPVKMSDVKAMQRGKLVYERMCMACHMEKAGGTTAVSRLGVPAVPLLTSRVSGFKDGYIFNYVTMGGALMPAHGPQIVEADRWKAINYLRKRLADEGVR